MSLIRPPKASALQSQSSTSSRTPLYRKSFGKVLGTASPAPGSRTPCAVAFVNNDEEERRQRRLETHGRSVMSPRIHIQNRYNVYSLHDLIICSLFRLEVNDCEYKRCIIELLGFLLTFPNQNEVMANLHMIVHF